MYTVYRVSGPHTFAVYYGYCDTTKHEIRDAYLAGANRSEDDRGDRKLLLENKGDESSLVLEPLSHHEEEIDAFSARNDHRSKDAIRSITGPTDWPSGVYKRAIAKHPQKVEQWRKADRVRKAKTARQAYALGHYSKHQIGDLRSRFDESEIKVDLDKLTPREFDRKYRINVTL